MKKHKLLKVWQLVLIDLLLTGLCLCVFAYFDHVRPQYADMTDLVYVRITQTPTQTPEPVQTEATAVDMGNAIEAEPTPGVTEPPVLKEGEFWFPDVFTDGEIIRTPTSYKSANVSIEVTNVVLTSPSKQSYFVEDIYIRSIDCLRTLFAEDRFGKSVYEHFMPMVERANAIAAINTDMYGWGSRTGGLVIRNGALYRKSVARKEDMLIIYRDGSMQAILAGTEFDAKKLIDDGAWQAFSFGPSLLDKNGEVRKDLEKTNHDPRTVIGMIEPGHYVFIVFDGRRDSTYARGYDFKMCAEVCAELGCKVAFNLDGGESSQMAFDGQLVNRPYKNGRRISDILYVCEPQ